MNTTKVTLPSGPEVLTFGTAYRVEVTTPVGRGDAFRGTLRERARNGDLIFVIDGGWTRRIPTNRLLTVEEDAPGVPVEVEITERGARMITRQAEEAPLGALLTRERADGEPAGAFLSRLERAYPHNYPAFVGTDEGQALLGEAAKEASAGRRAERKAGKPHDPAKSFTKTERETISEAVRKTVERNLEEDVTPKAIAEAYVAAALDRTPDLNPAILPDLLAYAETLAVGFALTAGVRREHAARVKADDPAPRRGRYAAGVRATRVVLDGRKVSETTAPPLPEDVLARRERENGRNRIWRCPACKRRTRQAECSNGHPSVSASTGKRRDERDPAI